MKTAIRKHAAAALLLLPLAALVAAAPPAHAQSQWGRVAVEEPAPVIERFVLHARGRIERGRELRFRLRGAPGADAWIDIPGVIRGIDLVETRPGVYEADYTVRRRDDVRAFGRATATLVSGDQQAVARVEIRGDGWDRRDAWGWRDGWDRRDERDERDWRGERDWRDWDRRAEAVR